MKRLIFFLTLLSFSCSKDIEFTPLPAKTGIMFRVYKETKDINGKIQAETVDSFLKVWKADGRRFNVKETGIEDHKYLYDPSTDFYYEMDHMTSGTLMYQELDPGKYYFYLVSYDFNFETAGYMVIEKDNDMPVYELLIPFDTPSDTWIEWEPVKKVD